MQARYVILRVLLEGGGGLVTVSKTTGADGRPDVEVTLNRALIATLGKDVIGSFLLKLQTHKSLGDVAAGSAMFNGYSEVPADMLELRAIVMVRPSHSLLCVCQLSIRPERKNLPWLDAIFCRC